MAEGIFIERDGHLVDVRYSPFVAEDDLQALLEQHAVLLAGDQMSPDREPRRFVLVQREAGVPDAVGGSGRWSLDHLFVDQDAVPTLVEVKRGQNTQIRREVVGQMFDYAANAVVYWAPGVLAEHFATTHRDEPGGPNAVLRQFLQLENQSPEAADAEIEAWWQQAEANLRAGRLRLLFVADEIPAELRRIIEFLNEQMATTEVLGIEVKSYSGDGLRALVPRVVGLTEAARDRKARRTPSISLAEAWDVASPSVLEARRILDEWADRNGLDIADLTKSRRYRYGSTAVVYLYPTEEYRLAYIMIGAGPDPEVTERLRGELSRIRGGAPVSPKEVTISCEIFVRDWQEIETGVLTPLVRSLGDAARK